MFDKEGRSRGPAGLAVDENGTVAVTMAEMTMNDKRISDPRYAELRLDDADGRELGTRPAQGKIIAIRGGRRYAYQYTPYTAVVIY